MTAPGHPTALEDLLDNVKVVFLSPNMTALLQPMDLGVLATFKAYYSYRTFAQVIRATDGDNDVTLKEF